MDELAWFGPDDAEALRDFFAVYASNVDVVEVVTESAADDRTLVPVARAMAPSWSSQVAVRKRELLRAAVLGGDWGPYAAALRREATEQADDGAVGWKSVMRTIARRLTTPMLAAYEHDPSRLAGALRVMYEFLDRAQTTLSAAYFERRDALLRESEQRTRRLVESDAIGVWFFDAEGRTTFMNERMSRMLGLAAPDTALRSIAADFVDPEGHAALDEAAVQRRAGVRGSREQRIRRRDGSVGWIVLECSPLYDAAGRFEGELALAVDITARKYTEDALRAADLRFRRLFDSGAIGIIVSKGTGQIEEANDAFLKMVGYAREDLEAGAMDWRAMTPADWSAAGAAAGARLMATGSTGTWEKEYLRRDGSRVPVLVGLALLEGGKVLSISIELTELKRSEARKSSIVDASLDAIIGMDAAGCITEFNPAAVATFGTPRAQVLGRALADVMVPQRLRDSHLATLAQLGAGDAGVASAALAQRTEVAGLRADGTEFPAEVAFVRAGGDGPASFIAFVRDISDRRRAEAELAERVAVATLAAEVGVALTHGDSLRDTLRRCAEALVRHLGAAFARIWTLNPRENVLELQASAGIYTHLDGAHARVPVGRYKIGAIAEERRAYATNDVPNDPRVSDHEWARREGMVAFAGHPLIVGGELVGVLAMFARAPMGTAMHVALGYVADTVGVGIRQRLLVAANAGLEDQLRQAQKMEAIGRLAGGVAHDFNNLLSVILSYSGMLAADIPPNDPMRAELDAIHDAGARAADLTRQLLAFSRQQILAPKVVDPFELVTGMMRMLGRLLGENVQLTTIAPIERGHVRVDPGQFEQVVMNLAVNARDAMPGGGKLTLEVGRAELDAGYAAEHVGVKPGPYVLLAVSDTGTGIDRATQARIFEPFFTTKEQGKGTGLGLSTVFGIVQQSGGHIAVYSEPGRGTTFKVYLPCTDPAGGVPAPTVPPARPARGSETVLLVEDEPSVRALARVVLRRHGYVVVEAQSVGEALLVSEDRATTIDLLLTDVVMPQMGGRELADRLLRQRPAMKVLFMSGYTDRAIVHHGVLDAGVAFLQKPLTPDALLRRVREVLDVAPAH